MTSSSTESFCQMIRQVQIAHRLTLGFYQRLLPTIKHIADELDLTFWKWEPAAADWPCRKSKQPADHWALDMLPLYFSNHYYCKTERNEAAKIGDIVVGIWIIFDTNFYHWDDFDFPDDQEPDATSINLPIGLAEVEIVMGRCVKANGKTLEDLWGDTKDINEDDTEKWQTISPQMQAFFLKKPIADFVSSPEKIIHEINFLEKSI